MDVNATDFERILNTEPGVLLDVRTSAEFHSGHIGGALNADVMNPHQFESEVSRLNPNQRVYVYCRSGGRSGVACHMLRQKGFNDIVHLATGIMSYNGELV
jgi:rhodanese-related sulfurtransferase